MIKYFINLSSAAVLLLFAVASYSQSKIYESFSQPKTSESVNVEIKRIEQAATDKVEIEIILKMFPEVHIYSSEDMFFKIEETDLKGLGGSKIILPKSVKYKNFAPKK